MKTLLTFALITLATFANAKDITREELDALYVQYKDSYENITPGMTSEYKEKFTHLAPEEATEEELVYECEDYVKEVVISTDHLDRYLVYRKMTSLNDCMYSKKGHVYESLSWRQIDRVDQSEEGIKYFIDYSSIKIDGTILSTIGNVTFLKTQDKFKFSNTRDLSKSQFYNLLQSKGENPTILLRRTYTDPATINIENIEFNDYETLEND